MKIFTATAWHEDGMAVSRSWVEGLGYCPDNRDKRILDGPVRGVAARLEALRDAKFELEDRWGVEISGLYLTESLPPFSTIPAVGAQGVDHLGIAPEGREVA